MKRATKGDEVRLVESWKACHLPLAAEAMQVVVGDVSFENCLLRAPSKSVDRDIVPGAMIWSWVAASRATSIQDWQLTSIRAQLCVFRAIVIADSTAS
jgi:hypothetical protein